MQTFRTSTPRVIGVELDLSALRLRFWIDGKPLDDMSKSIPAGNAWIPTVHFVEKDLEVVLNPYCVSSDAACPGGLVSKALRELRDDSRSGGQHSFPACLSQSTAALQSAYLASELDSLLVAYDFRTHDSAGQAISEQEALKQARRLSSPEDFAATVTGEAPSEEESKEDANQSATPAQTPERPDLPSFEMRAIKSSQKGEDTNEKEKEECAIQYALLKFQDGRHALAYLVMAKQSHCVLSYLSSHQLAKLLRMPGKAELGAKEDSSALQGHFPLIENAEQLASDITAALRTTDLLSPERRARVFKYAGQASTLPGAEAQRDAAQIVSSLAKRPLPGAPLAEQPGQGSASPEVHATYLPASDKVLISRNHELKLVSREAGGRSEFFEDPVSAHFGNRIREVLDEVSLFLPPSELKWLVDTLDWSCVENQHLATPFLERLESSYDGRSVRAPFLEALLAIKGLTQVAIQQAKQIEDRARALEADELTLREGARAAADEDAQPRLDFVDANKLLSVLAGLEDQLYQIANQSETLSAAARKILCRKDLSRAHTALGRLASLLSLPSDQQICPLALAEHGVCNTWDTNLPGGLRFYQHLQVDLENIYDNSTGAGKRDIQAALEEQFRNNLMVRGFDSWNVPLHRSLNSMPPKSQWSGLRGTTPAPTITGHLALPSTDFVLTSSAQDASVNIWSTRAGLTRVCGLNFKLQAFIDAEGSLQRARLYFLNLEEEDVGSGVKIYARGQLGDAKQSPDAKQAEADPEKDEKEEKEKGDGELMQAMFDESAVTGEACLEAEAASASIAQLDDLQAEYEQAKYEQDPDFIDDVFSANEIGEELGKQSADRTAEKLKDAKKQAQADKKAAEKAEKKGALPPKKSSAKEDKPATEEKPVVAEKTIEPNLEFLGQLTDMGFPEDLGRRALVKVKNESVAAAVEAVVALQAESVVKPAQEPPGEAKRTTVAQWNCEMCTIINQPGGASCHICFSAAPASAYVDEGAEKTRQDEELRLKTEAEERLAKEKEQEAERQRLEEQARLEEERRREEVQQEFRKTKQFLEQSTVVGFLFGSIKKAQDRRPLFVGAVMNNREEGVTDVHLRCLEYRRQYLANFVSAPTLAGTVENRLTKERFASEAACLDALLANNQLLLESLYPALGGQHDASRSFNSVMGSADVGVVRLPLKEVAVVCQLGADVSPEKPLQVLVMGRKADSSTAAYIVTMKHAATFAGRATLQLGVKELESELFGKVQNSEVRDVQFCSKTGQLVVRTPQDIAVYSF